MINISSSIPHTAQNNQRLSLNWGSWAIFGVVVYIVVRPTPRYTVTETSLDQGCTLWDSVHREH